jgi:hypothetical protein
MSHPDFLHHPMGLVTQWVQAVGHGWNAHFSRYRYVPQALDDTRIHLSTPLEEVTLPWLIGQLSCLDPDQELAMHSTLTRGRRVMHIPMVDFASKAITAAEVLNWANQHLGIELQLFDSGRAYHGYGLRPVSALQWVRLMGLLLLANLPDKAPVVDTRWIGHRLLAGYSSLRWSKNTLQYIRLPTQVS